MSRHTPKQQKYIQGCTFSKEERLCSYKKIQELFSNGSSFFLYPFKVFFSVSGNLPPHQVVFAVPKKRLKKAPHRNTVKRRCKEAYRLNKHSFYLSSYEREQFYDIVFVYVAHEVLSYHEIENKLKRILKRFSNDTTINTNTHAKGKD